MKGIQKFLLDLLCMGFASGRPAPGAVLDAGLAGGSGIHLDAISNYGCCGDGVLTMWGCCPALGQVLQPVPRTP